LAESPVVIVGCGDRKASPDWYIVDVSIALENMVIAATAEGLGIYWIGSFDEANMKGLLNIPEGYEVVALLAMGYPKKPGVDRLPRGRRSLGRSQCWKSMASPSNEGCN
jgi:nitroreductase